MPHQPQPDQDDFPKGGVSKILRWLRLLNFKVDGLESQILLFASRGIGATKRDVKRLETLIMTLQESFRAYTVKRDEYDTRQEAATDILTESLTGLTGDVKGLKDEIKKLQDSAGEVTPEDAASIDRIQARADRLTVRVEAAAAALKTLNEETPAIPDVPPV